jgi:dihydropteroate synthase
VSILFVTGKLAEPALRRTLATLDVGQPYEIVALKITVAALMTTHWIARHLVLPPDCALVVIPGLCAGDEGELAQTLGVPVRRGPADLQDLPLFFGKQRRNDSYGAYSMQIVAEIQDAPGLSDAALLAQAEYYRANGADVIDLGVAPCSTPEAVERAVRLLKQHGYRVSVDTLDGVLLARADAAGCDMLLSLNGSNLALGRELRAQPVVVPDDEGGVESLWRSAETLYGWGLDPILDPIVQPIGFGFARSLADLYATRQRFPEAKLMLGAHHLSELTDADSTGINALVAGFAQELNITYLLTTEVAPWAKGSVRQLDIARRLVYYALTNGVLPKRLDDGLLTTRDPRLLRYAPNELRELQAALTDPNVRIFVGDQQIYAFNADVWAHDTDIEALWGQLGIDEPSHAFYLGCELTKAQLALQLGKTYRQDQPLRWGYLTVDAPPRPHKRVKLTGRRKQQTNTED